MGSFGVAFFIVSTLPKIAGLLILSTASAWLLGKSWIETGAANHQERWSRAWACGIGICSALGFTWAYIVPSVFAAYVRNWAGPDLLTGVDQITSVVCVVATAGFAFACLLHWWALGWKQRAFGAPGLGRWKDVAHIYAEYSGLRGPGCGVNWGTAMLLAALVFPPLAPYAGMRMTRLIAGTAIRKNARDVAKAFSGHRVVKTANA